LRVAKKIRTQTSIGQKVDSIGHAALDLAKKVFGNLGDHRLLIIGAGDATGAEAFDGFIDDAALYDYALDAGDIRMLGSGGKRPRVQAGNFEIW